MNLIDKDELRYQIIGIEDGWLAPPMNYYGTVSLIDNMVVYNIDIEKLKQKTIKKDDSICLCPTCNNSLYTLQKFCDVCGQHLRWV